LKDNSHQITHHLFPLPKASILCTMVGEVKVNTNQFPVAATIKVL